MEQNNTGITVEQALNNLHMVTRGINMPDLVSDQQIQQGQLCHALCRAWVEQIGAAIVGLRAKNDDLIAKLNKATEEKEDLSEALRICRGDNEELRIRVEDAANSRGVLTHEMELAKELTALRKENHDWTQKVGAQLEVNQNLKTALAALEDELMRRDAQDEALKKETVIGDSPATLLDVPPSPPQDNTGTVGLKVLDNIKG